MLDPLTAERIERRAGERTIVVALSGGGDSVALLHLLAERFGCARLHAAIVDHKLRHGSEFDAQSAAEMARLLDVRAQVLELDWADGANRAHEAARRLRYAALCNHARRVGASVIATGHTRDDQAETVLLRAARCSGLRGLAGMRPFAPAPIWPEGRGLWLARPLLGAGRTKLRESLAVRAVGWIEDPANENEAHARVRARRVLGTLRRGGFEPMRLSALAERLQLHAARIDRDAAALIEQTASFEEDASIVVDSRWLAPDAVKQRALEALVAAASGEQRGPTLAQLETLSSALGRPEFTGATVAGAWLQRRGECVVIRRDPGALGGRTDGAAPAAPLPLQPNQEAVWDGRVALTASEPGWFVVYDGRAPVLQRGEERRPLAAASPHWLLRERVQHMLGTD